MYPCDASVYERTEPGQQGKKAGKSWLQRQDDFLLKGEQEA